MSKSLGSILCMTLFLCVDLFASTYTWSASANKTQAYMNEAIYLEYVCTFSDKSELYTIDFNPQGEDYSLFLLQESEKIINEKRVNRYEFVAFAKKAKEIVFDFHALMKHTTQASIDSTIGGRDNDREKEDFTATEIKLPVLKVDIAQTNTSLVGEFTLKVLQDSPDIQAYEPYHMEIRIEGVGNFNAIKPFTFRMDGVKIFSEAPKKELKLTQEGFQGLWSQKFAFVAKEDFTLPQIQIQYFDLKTKTLKTLVHDAIQVKVQKLFVKEELLDEVPADVPWHFPYEYLYYLLTFIAGYLFAKIRLRKRASEKKELDFKQKLSAAKSLNEFAVLLTLKDATRYKELLKKIDIGKISSLAEAKKEL